MQSGDHQQLGRIEAKLDQLLADQGDHETRIRSLEKLRWLLHGMWIVLGASLVWIANQLHIF